jgi:hypothetical protein
VRRSCKDGINWGRIVDSRNRKKNSRITGDDTSSRNINKEHEEYKEAEKTTRIAALKAADESAQNVLAEITAEIDYGKPEKNPHEHENIWN